MVEDVAETGQASRWYAIQTYSGHENKVKTLLERKIADRRIFPAIDINRSGTRKEELLLEPDILNKVWILRKFLNEQSPVEAIEFLVAQMSKTKDNKKFLEMMNA